jgi:hypothetical protein
MEGRDRVRAGVAALLLLCGTAGAVIPERADMRQLQNAQAAREQKDSPEARAQRREQALAARAAMRRKADYVLSLPPEKQQAYALGKMSAEELARMEQDIAAGKAPAPAAPQPGPRDRFVRWRWLRIGGTALLVVVLAMAYWRQKRAGE